MELWGIQVERVRLPPNFQRPLAAKLCIRPSKVFEVQERARGPLSPCQIWMGSDFTRRRAAKNVKFFVCLSVRHDFERQSLCARFRHEGVGVQKHLCRVAGNNTV